MLDDPDKDQKGRGLCGMLGERLCKALRQRDREEEDGYRLHEEGQL